MTKSLFNCSSYSHPEIGKFQGVTGFWWFTRKPLGSLVDPQSQDQRTEDGDAAAPDRYDWWV
jgi:hypothetical protein